MNKTQKILKFILEEKPQSLIQIQNFVKAINGTSSKQVQGYYTSNLHRLVDTGLVGREGRGIYFVTPLGQEYINDKLGTLRKIRRNSETLRRDRAIKRLEGYINAIKDGDLDINELKLIKL